MQPHETTSTEMRLLEKITNNLISVLTLEKIYEIKKLFNETISLKKRIQSICYNFNSFFMSVKSNDFVWETN